MDKTLILRIADSLLALWWAWMLVQSLISGRVGGRKGINARRNDRPRRYWSWVALLVLMVLHFGGLAVTGQR